VPGRWGEDGRLKHETGVTRVLKNALVPVPKKKTPAKEAKKTVQKKTKKTVQKKKAPAKLSYLDLTRKGGVKKPFKTRDDTGPRMPKGVEPGDTCYMMKRVGDDRRMIKGKMTTYKRATWVKTPQCLKNERNDKACTRTTKRQKEKNKRGWIYKCYNNGDQKPGYMAKRNGEKFRRTTWIKELRELKSLTPAQCRELQKE